LSEQNARALLNNLKQEEELPIYALSLESAFVFYKDSISWIFY